MSIIRGQYSISIGLTFEGPTAESVLCRAAEACAKYENENVMVTLGPCEVKSIQRFKVSLRGYENSANKISTIKSVRGLTDWGLKQAKDFVEGVEVEMSATQMERARTAFDLAGLRLTVTPILNDGAD